MVEKGLLDLNAALSPPAFLEMSRPPVTAQRSEGMGEVATNRMLEMKINYKDG